ncbi:MAG: hypothetical protein ACOYJF_03975 [Prevotella sp.]|jgi:hypothetical protein
MKQLNKWQSIAFLLGGALMVIGAGSYVLMFHQSTMCWIFLVGALLFSVMQLMQTYEGNDLTLRRLKRLQSLAGLLFVLSGILMTDSSYGFFRTLFHNPIDYINYIYNKWVLLLLIAAIIEVYTTHRIDHVLSKKNIKD